MHEIEVEQCHALVAALEAYPLMRYASIADRDVF